jgi:hypothetical protein
MNQINSEKECVIEILKHAFHLLLNRKFHDLYREGDNNNTLPSINLSLIFLCYISNQLDNHFKSIIKQCLMINNDNRHVRNN